MSKNASKKSRAEEDDIISHQAWAFSETPSVALRESITLIQLCTAFNISDRVLSNVSGGVLLGYWIAFCLNLKYKGK
jgi:hypothetical protein